MRNCTDSNTCGLHIVSALVEERRRFHGPESHGTPRQDEKEKGDKVRKKLSPSVSAARREEIV